MEAPRDPGTIKPPRPTGIQKGSWFRSNLEALGMAVILAVVLRIFVVQAFTIPSGSMIPTLQVGDYILVNKFIYNFRPISRGDIVVFRSPEDPDKDYIKRVIGLPGEEVAVKEGAVFIDGIPMDEPYVLRSSSSFATTWGSTRSNWGPSVVPAGNYFVMGDNRSNSRDSRVWGFLDGAKIRGRAFVIYFSWDGEGRTIRWGRLLKTLH